MTSIGALIKAAREGRRWSQNRLATVLNEASGHATMDGQYVSRWERGIRTPDEFWLRHLAHVLHLDLAQLERTVQGDYKRLDDLDRALMSRLVINERVAIASSSDNGMQGEVSFKFGAEAMLMDSADESAELLAWVELSNVGDLTIEQIHADIYRISHSYLKTPTLPLFQRTRALRSRVVGLLAGGRQRPSHSRDLYSAAGWSCALLAWMSIDLNAPVVAEQHLRAAWAFAESADQNNLRAWIRAGQHTAAFWQTDYARAARCAEDGLRYAETGTSELFLSSALALDLARSGGAAERALEILAGAHKAADKAPLGVDALTGPFACSVGRAGGFWSDTRLALGDHHAALEHANAAIDEFEATPSERRNLGTERMIRCQQVKAHLVAGQFDGAIATLDPVLNTSPEHRVRPLLQRVAEISQMAAGLAKRNPAAAGRMQDATVEFRRSHAIEIPPGQPAVERDAPK